MTIDAFLEHWNLIEHPFRGEEARQDGLFARMVETGIRSAAENPLRPSRMPRHPDYDKIAGDFGRPSTAIVFGEKGSGKTSIRLQMAASAAAYNAANPGKRVLLISYDELAPVLQRLHDRVKTVKKGKESSPLDSLKQFRLQDHVDAILGMVVPRIIDAALEHVGSGAGDRIDLGPEARKAIRKWDRGLKRDLMVLQVAYDRAEEGGDRTRELRKALGIRMPAVVWVEDAFAFGGWLIPLVVYWLFQKSGAPVTDPTWVTMFFAAMGLWLVALLMRAATERFGIRARARRLWKQIRVSPRNEGSYRRSIRSLIPAWRISSLLPTTGSIDVRLSMLARMSRVLRLGGGYEHVIVVIDRVDEPPLIAGDPERMKAVIWPLLNNRFLQQGGSVGASGAADDGPSGSDRGIVLKMLLPIELRYVLLRESAAFFQDARLDKQSMIEQLAWSGVALYDLCNQRLNASRPKHTSFEQPLTLVDLFGPEVTREHLIEALEQVRQPRDAFKLLYQCIYDHCTQSHEEPGLNDASEPSPYRIPKRTLDAAKKSQVERLRQLAMGVRPG